MTVFLCAFGSHIALAKSQTITLIAPTMNCAVCPITVKKSLEKVEGVEGVETDFESRSITVRYDDAKTNLDVLTETTKNAGYPSSVKEQ